jgi:hypothetical protein
MLLTIALVGAFSLLIPATASAEARPELADPAQPSCPDSYGSTFACYSDLDLSLGSLASHPQRATIATGSTEGFPADRRHHGGAGPGFQGTPGATGWWAVDGPNGSTLTIDTCGSSFTAQITLYETEWRYGHMYAREYTADACANPISADYDSEWVMHYPDLVRIDDATATGGAYQVNYRRTPDTAKPEAEAFKPVVGTVRRPKGARRVGRAKVRIEYFAEEDEYGSHPIQVRCVLRSRKAKVGRRVKRCAPGRDEVTYRRVRSGKHVFKLKVTDAAGNTATAKRKFRVRYLKPRRR